MSAVRVSLMPSGVNSIQARLSSKLYDIYICSGSRKLLVVSAGVCSFAGSATVCQINANEQAAANHDSVLFSRCDNSALHQAGYDRKICQQNLQLSFAYPCPSNPTRSSTPRRVPSDPIFLLCCDLWVVGNDVSASPGDTFFGLTF